MAVRGRQRLKVEATRATPIHSFKLVMWGKRSTPMKLEITGSGCYLIEGNVDDPHMVLLTQLVKTM